MKLVKLDDVLELIDGSIADLESNYENSKLQEEIKRLPTIDAEPVRHGHWVSIGNTAFATCQCGYVTDRYMTYHYCPKCGAKMDLTESSSPNPNPNEKSGCDTEE